MDGPPAGWCSCRLTGSVFPRRHGGHPADAELPPRSPGSPSATSTWPSLAVSSWRPGPSPTTSGSRAGLMQSSSVSRRPASSRVPFTWAICSGSESSLGGSGVFSHDASAGDTWARPVSRGSPWPWSVSALTFPVWTTARTNFFADDFFQRNQADTWRFGSELWQFFIPHESPWAIHFVNDVQAKVAGWYCESHHFPGYTVLAAMAFYVVARLRGWRFRPEYAPLLDVLMGLIAVSILLSLAGGPSFFLYHFFPSIRCYGRALLIAVALGCVATPLILHSALGMTRSRWLRASIVVVALGLLVHDGSRTSHCIGSAIYGESHIKVSTPAWVDWLAGQPARTSIWRLSLRSAATRSTIGASTDSTCPARSTITSRSTGRTSELLEGDLPAPGVPPTTG